MAVLSSSGTSEKREHIRIELLVESDAVESWRVRADLGQVLCQHRRTGQQEGEVPGVRHHVILVTRGEVPVDGGNALGRHAVTAALGGPQLDRK